MNPNCSKIRSALSATLLHLADTGKITRKSIQFAADVSYSEANRWFSGDDSPTLQQFIQIINDIEIDSDARLAIASAIGLRVSINAQRPDDTSLNGTIRDALENACGATRLAKRISEICSDRIISNAESAEAISMISEMRTNLDDMETNVRAHTAVVQTVRPGSPLRSAI